MPHTSSKVETIAKPRFEKNSDKLKMQNASLSTVEGSGKPAMVAPTASMRRIGLIFPACINMVTSARDIEVMSRVGAEGMILDLVGRHVVHMTCTILDLISAIVSATW